MIEKQEITLSNGAKAKLIETKATYQNILIVQLDGVLRVIDKETKTLAQTLGGTYNKHAYYVNNSSR
ncbi:hypothetical protein [Lactococcus lactis]|uniref:hypothetical protein n=1 Tax=Lactococcus lactis TaxID=1358 RepID=UPI001D18B251|nr:hypothetical protein [Lactococcus lactis]MCC4119921.1 hypothetical protein [Lactococcus lactis]